MCVEHHDPAEKPNPSIHLSEAERRDLAELLGEAPPLAPWAADLKQGDVIKRGRRKFWAKAKDGTRMAVEGVCKTCSFPYTIEIDASDPAPRFPHHCEAHRRRPWADTPAKLKPHKKRRPRPILIVDHAIAPRQAVAGQWRRGDVIVQAGHLYLILAGPRAAARSRAGKLVVHPQLLGCCTTCGAPFRFGTPTERLYDPTARLRRRCSAHTAAHYASKKPIPWSGKTLRAVARVSGLTVEQIVGAPVEQEAV
jgi:hypothetical protein